MKKRFTLFFAALALAWGSAWAESAVITKVTQLTDDMECMISTARGGWAVNAAGDNFGSTSDHGFGTKVDIENPQHLFQFKNINSKYYLYSVYAEKFVNKDRTLSAEAQHAIEFLPQSGNTFVVKFDDEHVVNIGGSNQIVINGWGTPDAGNKVTITAASVDAKTRLTMLVDEVLDAGEFGVFPLQTNNPEAAYYLSATQQGDAHISAAIDKDPGTHYGSTWGSEVGSHHYWQVDLGEGTSLDSFVFSYVTRENGKDTPLQINIKGSVDGIDFTNTILTLTKDGDGLPIKGGTSYTSAVIGNPENYRYIRFEVPSTTTNFSQPNKPEQEVTIAIAEFSMKSDGLLTEKDKAVKAAVEAAQELLAEPNPSDDELGKAYIAIKMAMVERPTYPFIVTTDDKTPVLYGIKSGRTNNNQEWWYRYNMTDGTISLTQYADEEAFYWYFKEVFTDDYVYALQLCPYVGEGVMSYENTTDGPNKVVAKNPEAEDWSNLWILATTNGTAPYGLQTYNKANYLSNFGGVGNKMGMWNDTPARDGGTAMYFMRVNLPMLDIAPSNAEALDSITRFTVTCDEGISVAESFHAILTNSEEYIVEISAEQVNETTVELVLPNTLKVEGTYMLNIQDGSFKLGTIYPHLSSYASEEVRMTYEIMDKTPLVLVSSSIENGAVVDAFKDVEMTFSHALAKVKKTDKLPYLVNNDGEVVSTVSFTYQDADGKWYDDNTIRFVVDELIGVSGVYTLVIPAKFITVLSGWRVRATEDIRLSVTVEVSALVNPVMNIAPSNETPLESISNFTITCEQGISIAETFYASFTNWMSYNVELTAEQVNETTIVLALPETLKSEGSYMLSIAPGSFKLDPNGLNVASDETYMMFEVVDNTPFSFVSSSIENGSVVDSFSDIVLTFSHNIMEIPTDENLPYILNAEGEVVSQVEYTYQDAEGNWYEEFNVIRFVVTEAITTPGAYTFVMPKEFVVKGSDYVTTVSEDIKINIVVASNEEAAIRNFEVVGSDVIYTITGKAVQGDVKTLERGIYIVNGKKVFVK